MTSFESIIPPVTEGSVVFGLYEYFAQHFEFSQSRYTTVQGFLSMGRTVQAREGLEGWKEKGKSVCTDFF